MLQGGDIVGQPPSSQGTESNDVRFSANEGQNQMVGQNGSQGTERNATRVPANEGQNQMVGQNGSQGTERNATRVPANEGQNQMVGQNGVNLGIILRKVIGGGNFIEIPGGIGAVSDWKINAGSMIPGRGWKPVLKKSEQNHNEDSDEESESEESSDSDESSESVETESGEGQSIAGSGRIPISKSRNTGKFLGIPRTESVMRGWRQQLDRRLFGGALNQPFGKLTSRTRLLKGRREIFNELFRKQNRRHSVNGIGMSNSDNVILDPRRFSIQTRDKWNQRGLFRNFFSKRDLVDFDD